MMVPTEKGPAEPMIYVTYFAKGLTPGMLSYRKEEWSEEKEATDIREDIKKRREVKPTTIRL